jgi:hypothetical protein
VSVTGPAAGLACGILWPYARLRGTTRNRHQEKIHLLENGLKALKTAFERSKSSQAK